MSTEPGYQSPSVTVSSSLSKARVGDAVLIVPVVCTDDRATVLADDPYLDSDAVAAIEDALRALGRDRRRGTAASRRGPVASGGERADRRTRSTARGAPPLDGGEWPADKVRRAAGVAARSLDKAQSVVTTLSALDLGAAVEGLILGAYKFNEFRSAKTAPKEPGLRKITALAPDTKSATKAQAERAGAIATAVATARDFVNTPPSHLFPAEFASRAEALAEAAGLEVEVLDEKALARKGYGGVIGVGKGSSRPPRLVRLTYRGAPKRKGAKTVALIGKGVTFDTGGISIKPAANMHHMTSDMGGAAAVIATTVLAAKLELPIDVIATVPMAENMPSATAQRPGDVLTQYGGITVEVLNTDAEGRLILADAIARACEDNPDYLIETSTLTGAQTVALGARTPGRDGQRRVPRPGRCDQPAGWARTPGRCRCRRNSRTTSSRPVADLANVSGSRYAGMLVAGTFLREFVADGVQWAHIDIAGPAYNTGGPWGYTGKGGTGVPTRTMFAVLEDIAENG